MKGDPKRSGKYFQNINIVCSETSIIVGLELSFYIKTNSEEDFILISQTVGITSSSLGLFFLFFHFLLLRADLTNEENS